MKIISKNAGAIKCDSFVLSTVASNGGSWCHQNSNNEMSCRDVGDAIYLLITPMPMKRPSETSIIASADDIGRPEEQHRSEALSSSQRGHA